MCAAPSSSAIARTTWRLARAAGLGPLVLRVHPKSALVRLGWFGSFRKKRSIDQAGRDLPWWTYPAIHFLEERLRLDMTVLEFGSGSSTVWLAKRTRHVLSIENDAFWAAKVAASAPPNVHVELSPSMDIPASDGQVVGGGFDLIVNDALADRRSCADKAVERMSPHGVLLWDNTDGPDWAAIRDSMASRGFREVSFQGMTPQEIALGRTTLFYRRENCLGI